MPPSSAGQRPRGQRMSVTDTYATPRWTRAAPRYWTRSWNSVIGDATVYWTSRHASGGGFFTAHSTGCPVGGGARRTTFQPPAGRAPGGAPAPAARRGARRPAPGGG